jgi:hypothetical protein
MRSSEPSTEQRHFLDIPLEATIAVAPRGGASIGARWVREAVITPKGKAMTDKIDAARERMNRALFETWDEKDIADLVRVERRFAEAFGGMPKGGA